ncbi:MAG TPA: hypothetical protein VMV29_03330 [Ktedonobacterales bacterium]|nr:hypothetical protein [Ktedonobacterales bacterium]
MPDRVIPPDPYNGKMGNLLHILWRGPGKLDAATRMALGGGQRALPPHEGGGDIPAPLVAYAEKVRRYAYRVTDEDIAALKAAGYTEDQIFEATLSVAFGAARQRYVAGMAALYARDTAAPTPAAHDASDAGAAGDDANADSADRKASDDPSAAPETTSKELD